MNITRAFPLSRLVLALLTVLTLMNKGAIAQEGARISIIQSSTNEVCLAINPVTHKRLGVAYPLTFRFHLPTGAGVVVERKYYQPDDWVRLGEKSSADLYNAIEVVRIDSSADLAFVSVAFSAASDSIFLRFTSGGGVPLEAHYLGMPRYYDGRRAAVTVTADDWADWFANMYPPLLSLFRSYGLYVTAGVITGGVGYNTQLAIQRELDSGYVEIAAHSRTHPAMPYQDYQGEVVGCIDALLNSLIMPPLSRRDDQGYVYVWIAPNGVTNTIVDSLLTTRNILVNRLYGTGDTAFSAWSSSSNKFLPINPTLEIGNPSWGGGETRAWILNATFDSVTGHGGVYHFMWHPQTLYPDLGKAYLSDHLSYVSGRKDLWYVNLGHLYLYHYFQIANSTEVADVPLATTIPGTFDLMQNYPNPFNPVTTIKYSVGGTRDAVRGAGEAGAGKAGPGGSGLGARNTRLAVYDVLGREVAVLIDEQKAPGSYQVSFDGSRLASGVYFYRLSAGPLQQTRRMVLLR